MTEHYFKQIPLNYSEEFNNERIEMFSYDRIANTVTGAIMESLVDQNGWTQEAAIKFMQSRAMRFGLDQTLGELLEKAAKKWVKSEAPSWKDDCHRWAEEEQAA